VNPDILAQLLPKLYEATKNPIFANNTQNLPPQDVDNPSNSAPSTQNPVKGSDSSAIVTSNSTTTTQSSSQSYSKNSNSQGQAVSNVGVNGEAGELASSGSQGADVKKSIEINPVTSQSASEVGLSIIAVIGVLCLIGVIGLGYFRNRDEEEKIKDLDELYNEKIM
jgi:cobaltochelatase CobN